MKLTALEVQQQRFKKVFRGYDPHEVDTFLLSVAEAIKELTKWSLSLEEKLKRAKETLVDYEKRELLIKKTLTTAQEIVEEKKRGAEREVELLIGEARVRADKIIRDAHEQIIKYQDNIQHLKAQRIKFESELKAVLEYHQKLLLTEEEQRLAQDARDKKIQYLKFNK